MKLNTKKLNQYYMSSLNSSEMKSLVQICVENFIHTDIKNPQCVNVLTDLGLLTEV